MSISAFLDRCDRYCAVRSISLARLSTLIFNDGKKLDGLKAGRDIGVQTLDRAQLVLEGLEKALPATASVTAVTA